MIEKEDVFVVKNYAIIFNRYLVSKKGEFMSLESGRWLKYYLCNGYPTINLVGKGIKQSVKVHRVLALCFIPNPKNHPIINHIDGVKDNIRLDNLEWCTHSYNTNHAYREGLNDRVVESMRKTGLLNKGRYPGSSKKVIDIVTCEVHPTIKHAAESIGMRRHNLAKMLIGGKENTTNLRLYTNVFKKDE